MAQQADRYTQVRAANFLDWHPTKREMLINTRFGDVPQVHRVAAPGADRTQLTFFPDRVTSARYDPVNGKYFIFSKDIGGGEWFQYYRYDVKSGMILFFSRTNVMGDDLYVMFNKKGVVDEVVFGKRTNRLKFQFWPFGD